MIHRLHRVQYLNCNLDTAWDFFSSPNNLSRITPENMSFILLTDMEEVEIYEGMEIDYIVTPLLGIPLRWKTRIMQVDPFKSFTDYQEKGPFKLWNHHHEFIENDEEIIMKDNLTYEMPYGFIGKLFHRLLVKR